MTYGTCPENGSPNEPRVSVWLEPLLQGRSRSAVTRLPIKAADLVANRMFGKTFSVPQDNLRSLRLSIDGTTIFAQPMSPGCLGDLSPTISGADPVAPVTTGGQVGRHRSRCLHLHRGEGLPQCIGRQAERLLIVIRSGPKGSFNPGDRAVPCEPSRQSQHPCEWMTVLATRDRPMSCPLTGHLGSHPHIGIRYLELLPKRRRSPRRGLANPPSTRTCSFDRSSRRR